MAFASINPATEETLREIPALSGEELEARVARATAAFTTQRSTPLAARAKALNRAADIFEQEAGALGRIMTLEMGKPLGQAGEESKKCAAACRYYATQGVRFLTDEPVPDAGPRAYVRYEPLGPVLALMPWNFPFWQVVRAAAPALLAGNVVLLKHAENVQQCAEALEDVFCRAGFTPGCFQNLAVGHDALPGLIADDRIAGVTLTGSVAAGRSVGALAGRALKPCVLELGGSDPFIVLPGAPLAETAAEAARARVQNNGQSCIAAKRFLVHEEIYDAFTELFLERFRMLQMGDPILPGTDIGPLAHARAVATLEKQVAQAVNEGARVLTGACRPPGRGYYYEPTILTDLPPGTAALQEELFGPVAMLFRVRDLDEALAVANSTPFALGASVWTPDPAKQAAAIAGLRAGQVFVNGMVASQPALPFGGVGVSGHGRELGAPGLRAFTNPKSVVVA